MDAATRERRKTFLGASEVAAVCGEMNDKETGR